MIELTEVDVMDILCDMHECFELVSNTIEDEGRWRLEHLIIIQKDGTLFGFPLQMPKGEQDSWQDLNDFPIECFEVEIDPTPRYREKQLKGQD